MAAPACSSSVLKSAIEQFFKGGNGDMGIGQQNSEFNALNEPKMY